MFFKFNRIFYFVVLLFLSGCSGAGIKKEYIDISPNINFSKLNIGHGRRISVQVKDARSSQSLFSTCSVYADWVYVSKDDFKNTLKDSLESMLRAWDFKITPNSRSRILKITLLGLDYDGCTMPEIKAGAISVVKVTLVNGSQHYEKVYYESMPGNLFSSVGQISNNLSRSLNKALENISEDKKLLKSLSN